MYGIFVLEFIEEHLRVFLIKVTLIHTFIPPKKLPVFSPNSNYYFLIIFNAYSFN